MSVHIPCICKGTEKEKMKNWYVPFGRRNQNYSYFETPKGQAHPSAYSTVRCKKCHMDIRSKVNFVHGLPDEKQKS